MHHPYLHAFPGQTMRPCPRRPCLAATTPVSLRLAGRRRDAVARFSHSDAGTLLRGAVIPKAVTQAIWCAPSSEPPGSRSETDQKRSRRAHSRAHRRGSHGVDIRRTPCLGIDRPALEHRHPTRPTHGPQAPLTRSKGPFVALPSPAWGRPKSRTVVGRDADPTRRHGPRRPIAHGMHGNGHRERPLG